jgi:O-antigen ligase
MGRCVLEPILSLARDARGQVRNGRPCVEVLAASGLGSVPIVTLGFADGGFFPRPWAWAALGLAWTAIVVALVHRELCLSRRALALLGVLAALAVWIAASLVWTRSVSLSVSELQRLLVYMTGVGAAAHLIRLRSARALVLGVFLGTGTVVIWGLVSYLVTREHVSDVFQGSFLHRPMGYANAMGIAAVIALLLALGILTDSPSRPARTGAGVALVPLAFALALTGSRAAWGAFLVGAGIALAISPSRARTIAAWVWILVVPAAAVALVAATDPVSSQIVGARADRLGDRLLAALVALTAIAIVPALIVARRPTTAREGTVSRGRLWVVPIVALVGAGIVAGIALRDPDLAGDRPTFWSVATDEFERHPLLGSGAGTYAQVWLERRPVETSVRDAHSIVVETLSELGIVGLALVALLLGAPLVWGLRSRSSALVPAATAAFGAYAAHASFDWDWEMPAVTLAALFCAVAVGVTADGQARHHVFGAVPRGAAVALGGLASALALAGLVGASALEDATRALARGDPAAAEHAAERAERWQPWSVEPLLTRGQAVLSLGDRATARALFARATQRDPKDYRAWLALAAVSEGDAATAAVLRAQKLNPKAVRGT